MLPEIEALAARIDRLERANRRLKLISAAVGFALAVFLSLGAGGRPRTVEAEEIIIRDSYGHARLMIGTPEFVGPAIDMDRREPGIWLSDGNGQDRAMLSSDGLYFANEHSKPLLSLEAGRFPEIRLYGPDGKVSWSAP
ncbi:MAG TPA: hypothetical protein VMG35_13315 [Bryobacteraceae bacterium]|nr:hypothetical protein [Bryobacteraceae bacterium]